MINYADNSAYWPYPVVRKQDPYRNSWPIVFDDLCRVFWMAIRGIRRTSIILPEYSASIQNKFHFIPPFVNTTINMFYCNLQPFGFGFCFHKQWLFLGLRYGELASNNHLRTRTVMSLTGRFSKFFICLADVDGFGLGSSYTVVFRFISTCSGFVRYFIALGTILAKQERISGVCL